MSGDWKTVGTCIDGSLPESERFLLKSYPVDRQSFKKPLKCGTGSPVSGHSIRIFRPFCCCHAYKAV